jgi:hypothetical protein
MVTKIDSSSKGSATYPHAQATNSNVSADVSADVSARVARGSKKMPSARNKGLALL